MPDQLGFPVAQRHQCADRLSFPPYRARQNHRNHGDHHNHNDRTIQGKFGGQTIRLPVHQADARVCTALQILDRLVFFVNRFPKIFFQALILVTDRIKYRTAETLHRILSYDADAEALLVSRTLRKIVKHDRIVRLHAKSAHLKVPSCQMQRISHCDVIGFRVTIRHDDVIRRLDFSSLRHRVQIQLLRRGKKPQSGTVIIQIRILLPFQRHIIRLL